MFVNELRECFFLILLFSIAPLLMSSTLGIVVAVLQAATQIQEQTITYTVKFLAIAGLVGACAPWCFAKVVAYCVSMLSLVEFMGRSSL